MTQDLGAALGLVVEEDSRAPRPHIYFGHATCLREFKTLSHMSRIFLVLRDRPISI